MADRKLHKVLMFGDRFWDNFAPIEREMESLVRHYGTKDLLIISGGAPGADVMSEITAREWNVHVAVVKALWDTRHGGAGPQRNAIMRLLEPHEGICFHKNIKDSKGAANMCKQLRTHLIPHRVVTK